MTTPLIKLDQGWSKMASSIIIDQPWLREKMINHETARSVMKCHDQSLSQRTLFSEGPWYVRGVVGSYIRELTLYSTDDEPSYELELGPTRRKRSHLSFFPPTCRIGFTWPVLFSSKNGHFYWNLVIFPLFIFLSSDISRPRNSILFYFFPSDMHEKLLRIHHP